jgi:hypothetical protein
LGSIQNNFHIQKKGEKIMKKLFIIVMLIVGLMVSPAMACPEGDQCDDQYTGAMGTVVVGTDAAGGGIDWDSNWGAVGLSGAGGAAVAGGAGFVYDGTVYAGVGTTAGGLTDTTAFDGSYGGYNSFGWYSGVSSHNEAIVGGHSSVHVNGLGMVGAGFEGAAAQGSISMSDQWGTEGFAAQGSIGSLEGGAGAFLFGDAYAAGQIEMVGNSSSMSYNHWSFNGPTMTYETGTVVNANTTVNAMGYEGAYGLADAYVCGGYVAGGAAATHSEVNGGSANAAGMYMGAGTLNTNYQGAVHGSTYASETTVAGMNGQIVSTGASMSATSIINGNLD